MSLRRHLSDKKREYNFLFNMLVVQEKSQSTKEKAQREHITPRYIKRGKKIVHIAFDSILSSQIDSTGYSSPKANSNA